MHIAFSDVLKYTSAVIMNLACAISIVSADLFSPYAYPVVLFIISGHFFLHFKAFGFGKIDAFLFAISFTLTAKYFVYVDFYSPIFIFIVIPFDIISSLILTRVQFRVENQNITFRFGFNFIVLFISIYLKYVSAERYLYYYTAGYCFAMIVSFIAHILSSKLLISKSRNDRNA